MTSIRVKKGGGAGLRRIPEALQMLGLCYPRALWDTVYSTKQPRCLPVRRDYVRLSRLLWVTEPVSANAGSISQVVGVLVHFSGLYSSF